MTVPWGYVLTLYGCVLVKSVCVWVVLVNTWSTESGSKHVCVTLPLQSIDSHGKERRKGEGINIGGNIEGICEGNIVDSHIEGICEGICEDNMGWLHGGLRGWPSIHRCANNADGIIIGGTIDDIRVDPRLHR